MSEHSSALLRGLAATIGLASWMSLPSCYDWQLGPSPTDGGEPHDAARMDAERAESGSPDDATMMKPDGIAPKDAVSSPSDAHDASDCSELEANVRSTYPTAIACPVAGPACVAVKNECGCNVYVPSLTSSATTSYLAAVKALADNGCTIACNSSCVPFAPSECLTNATDGGVLVTACFQGQTP